MFKTRLLSGIVLVILAILLLTAGGPVLLFGLAAISIIGMSELYQVEDMKLKGIGVAGYVMSAVYYGFLGVGMYDDTLLFVLILSVMVFMGIYVFTFPKYQARQVMTAFFGLVYVSVMMSYIYRTRLLGGGIYLVWLVFLASWGCDTCAYCVGMLIGKHKMTPKLSPKKSVEGGIGGIVGAGLLGLLFGYVFRESLPFADPAISCMIICMIGAVISQIGDLAASAIKRNHAIKDYGKLIPGHGGILDRFDSVIFVAPAIYYAILLLQLGIQLL